MLLHARLQASLRPDGSAFVFSEDLPFFSLVMEDSLEWDILLDVLRQYFEHNLENFATFHVAKDYSSKNPIFSFPASIVIEVEESEKPHD